MKVKKMTHNALVVLTITMLICSCSSGNSKGEGSNNNDVGERAQNLRLMLLIDLSDRISTKVNHSASMPHHERDLEYIKSAVDAFSTHVRGKKTITLNESIELYIEPTPDRGDINSLLSELRFHFTKDNTSREKLLEMGEIYAKNCGRIYDHAIRGKRFAGSDIWGFFGNKIKDHTDSSIRNVLVVLTDGYIYHEKNTFRRGTQYSYLTPQLIQSLALRSADWMNIYQEKGCGLIPATDGLQDLEVLVLGINGGERSPFENEVITRFLSDWLLSMGVARFEVKATDLPVNAEATIRRFILQ